MTPTQRAAMQAALDALKASMEYIPTWWHGKTTAARAVVSCEAALAEPVVEPVSTATKYQQAADKMAMRHKVEHDGWIAMFDALQAESHTLRQQLAEAQTLIDASRKQKAVAGMYGDTKVSIGAPDTSDILHGWKPLYTSPPPAGVPLLSDFEVSDIFQKSNKPGSSHGDFARAIEQAVHKKAGIL